MVPFPQRRPGRRDLGNCHPCYWVSGCEPKIGDAKVHWVRIALGPLDQVYGGVQHPCFAEPLTLCVASQ